MKVDTLDHCGMLCDMLREVYYLNDINKSDELVQKMWNINQRIKYLVLEGELKDLTFAG